MPKGHFERTKEHRENISKALKGRVFSEKTLAIMSAQRKGRKASEEARRKMSESRKGKPSGRVFTEEMSANMSDGRRGKSGKLKAYGVSNQEYERRISSGERWCIFRKHFVVADLMYPRTSVCIECLPEYRRECNLRKSFGVSHDWYLGKMAEQGDCCGICRTPRVEGKKYFAVDHCHENGHVRGVLCGQCNASLERMETIPNWGVLASAYLQRYAIEEINGTPGILRATAPPKRTPGPKRPVKPKSPDAGGIV